MIRSACVLPLVLAAVVACDRDAAPAPAPAAVTPQPSSFAYDSAIARVATATDTFDVRVEVAERDDQRAYGLMERTALDEDAGMVFVYSVPQSATSGFWMYRTRIPLDIAFFGNDGRIVRIHQMDPCLSVDPGPCEVAARNYVPGEPYLGALEVNRGWFARHGVKAGDRITVVR